MKRTVCLCLAAVLVLPALAKRQDLGAPSADPPVGWKAEITDEGIFFTPLKGGGELNVRFRGDDSYTPENADQATSELAGDNLMALIGEGWAIKYEGADTITNGWVMRGSARLAAV